MRIIVKIKLSNKFWYYKRFKKKFMLVSIRVLLVLIRF